MGFLKIDCKRTWGDVEGLIMLNNKMGLIELDLGNLDSAGRHFQVALETAGEIGNFFHLSPRPFLGCRKK